MTRKFAANLLQKKKKEIHKSRKKKILDFPL